MDPAVISGTPDQADTRMEARADTGDRYGDTEAGMTEGIDVLNGIFPKGKTA